MLAAGAVSAQEPVSSLQDLIGAKGRDGEYQLERRGYTFIRTEKSDDSAYSYWQEQENGQCITVRTTDGRYASIVFAPASDCQRGGQAAPHYEENYDRKDEFETVCGVIVDGENYRYKCKAMDFYSGSKKIRTALHYPDQVIRLTWKSGNRVVLHFDGMTPQDATYSTSEGETNFLFEDKTYFYISNKDAARMEVQNFRD
jgi:hypothetical protein